MTPFCLPTSRPAAQLRSTRRQIAAPPGARWPSAAPWRGDADLQSRPLALALLVLLLLCGSAAASGQAPSAESPKEDSPQDTAALDEKIVVTAARSAVLLEDAVPSIIKLDERAIRESSALTSADLLRDVAGFSLLRADSSLTAHPTTQSVTLRAVGGTGASRALVLLDGVPLNDAYASWVSWNMVPTAALAEVEVSKGAGSAVWGNLALGGVIHLTSRDVTQSRMQGALKAGERGLLEVDLSAGAVLSGEADERSPWRMSVHGGYLDFDGYSNIAPGLRGPVDVPLDTRALTGQISVVGNTEDDTQLRFRLIGLDEERGAGTPLSGNATRRFIASAGYERVSSGATWSFRGHVQDSTFENFISSVSDDRTEESPAVDQFDIPAQALGISATWARQLTRHAPSLGVDVQFTDGENKEDFLLIGDAFARRRIAGGEQRLAGLFLGDRIQVGDRVEFELVGRIDRWEKRDGSRVVLDLSQSGTSSEELYPDGDETQISPRLGMVASLRPGLLLRASAYRGFRAPTVNELYKPFRLPGNVVTESNPDLIPEELLGAEVGLDFTRPRLFARFVGFYNDLDAPVINRTLAIVENSSFVAPCGFVPAPGSCRQRQNVGVQRSVGIDAEVRGSWGRSFSWGVQALLVDAEVRDTPSELGLEGLEPALIASETFAAHLTWRNPRWLEAALRLRWVGERFADDRNTFPLDEQTQLDVQLSRSFARFAVFAAAQNLLDDESIIDSSPALVRVGPPRLVHVGLRFALGGANP